MIVWIILYVVVLLVAWILFSIAYKRSGDNWKKFLKSRIHNTATILIYVSIALGLLFFPRLMSQWFPNANAIGMEFVGVLIDVVISLLVLLILTQVYKHKIKKNQNL